MVNDKQFQDLLKDNDPLIDLSASLERPLTANGSNHNLSPKELLEALDSGDRDPKYVAKVITMTLMSNWGHRQAIGLTGVFYFISLYYMLLLHDYVSYQTESFSHSLSLTKRVNVQMGWHDRNFKYIVVPIYFDQTILTKLPSYLVTQTFHRAAALSLFIHFKS